jgi:hypothetical protein
LEVAANFAVKPHSSIGSSRRRTARSSYVAFQVQHKSMMALFDNVLRIYTRPGVDYPLLGGARPFNKVWGARVPCGFFGYVQ